MRALALTIVGLTGVVLVAAAVVVVLSLMGASEPSCANGAVSVSEAAAQSFDAKWESFVASLDEGSAATVIFSEEELTSRAARFIEDEDVPAEDVQVHLCPGEAKGQAVGNLRVLGRDLDFVITGHVDLDKTPPDLAVDVLQMGRVPRQVTTWLVERILDITHLGDIEIPSGIDEVTTSSDAVTLSGQK